VAIFDQSGFSKYLFKGPDALNVLQRLCGGDIDVPTGKAVYTGMFNARGTFESDVTVIRIARTRFTSSADFQTMRDLDWIRRNLQDGERADLTDVTEAYSVIVSWDRPRARCSAASPTLIFQSAFPFGTAQALTLEWRLFGQSALLTSANSAGASHTVKPGCARI